LTLQLIAPEILLVGTKIVHLQDMLNEFDLVCDREEVGTHALSRIADTQYRIVIFGLELSDIEASDFVDAVRQTESFCQLLLVEDPSKAGQILRVFQRGVNGFHPSPPKKEAIYNEVMRLWRLAELSFANPEATADLTNRVTYLESQIIERDMQNELLRQEIETLRQQEMEDAGVDDRLIQHQVDNAALRSELEDLKRQSKAAPELTALTHVTSSEEDGRIILKDMIEQTEHLQKLEIELEEALKERDLARAMAAALETDIRQLEVALQERLSQMSDASEEKAKKKSRSEEAENLRNSALKNAEIKRSQLSARLAKSQRACKKAEDARANAMLDLDEIKLRVSYWEDRAKKAEHILRKLSKEQTGQKNKPQ
jgi:DNA-binding NarL/FixJ family response regulator